MQLESLLAELGLTAHTARLSTWRDNLLRENAAVIKTVIDERDELASALQNHQQAADAITAGASGILNNNNLTADQKLAGLATALAKAAEFASGREKTRLEAEAAQLRQEAAAKQAEADAIASA